MQARERSGRHRPSAFAIVVAALVALVVIAAAVVAWSVWGTDWRARRNNAQALEDFRIACAANAQHPGGDTIAVISIPSLGLQAAVVKGVGAGSLGRGVGWYPTTSLPGQPGNFAVAGYRITHGSPFRNLAELRAGDAITVRDCTHTYHYRVITPASELTVRSHDSWVLDAVPGHPERVPDEAIMTITTSLDLVPSAERSVLFARLATS
ncbi:sortase A [Propionibacterium cyclohexanicum]|uniref:Sortase A n=1 Tax=Propionibacterium cyclohexanicum TaxID=64702 RepID=A0A1H9SUD9_9ACTN|nr:sortase [Propionibacterium cyclohexanicum]SER88487.1 sortase A [Propionibacterium cyclohexanicum]